jgi:hypothetical protein
VVVAGCVVDTVGLVPSKNDQMCCGAAAIMAAKVSDAKSMTRSRAECGFRAPLGEDPLSRRRPCGGLLPPPNLPPAPNWRSWAIAPRDNSEEDSPSLREGRSLTKSTATANGSRGLAKAIDASATRDARRATASRVGHPDRYAASSQGSTSWRDSIENTLSPMPFCWTPTSANRKRFGLPKRSVGLGARLAILGSEGAGRS